MAGDYDELTGLLLSGLSGPLEDLNSLLYSEPEPRQQEFLTLDQLQPGHQLSMGEIQQILELPSAPDPVVVVPRPGPPRPRSESLTVPSPESGISCDGSEAASPQGGDGGELLLPRPNPAQTFDNIDLSSLLALANESTELVRSSEWDLQRLEAAKPTGQLANNTSSPLLSANNPLLGGGGIIITGPNHLGTQYNSQFRSPTPSVIVTNSAARRPAPRPASNYSLPGALALSAHQPTHQTIQPTSQGAQLTTPELPAPVAELQEAATAQHSAVKLEPSDYLCYVCGEKAGKHSYYGGQVCASCRAFFRRSVQSKYYEIFQCKREQRCPITANTRKNCQFCRFKKCLESGMKPAWVLSDEERNRRFNKFNKVNNLKSVAGKVGRLQPSRIPELYMAFTVEEQKTLDDIHQKFHFCQKTWLKNILLYDRNAGINMIEAAYKLAPLKLQTWKVVEKSFKLFFVQHVVPNFIDLENLPSADKGKIIHGGNSSMAHLFKSSQCMRMESKSEPACKSESMCPLQKQVSDIAANPAIVEDLDLSLVMSRLSLAEGVVPSLPTYQEIFPASWAGDSRVEQRHREIMQRIQAWPKNQHDQCDKNMVVLMALILIFNADYDSLVNKEVVEKTQLKYSVLLQRYMRSQMAAEFANKKFLEAMLLLSFTREIWELNELYT